MVIAYASTNLASRRKFWYELNSQQYEYYDIMILGEDFNIVVTLII